MNYRLFLLLVVFGGTVGGLVLFNQKPAQSKYYQAIIDNIKSAYIAEQKQSDVPEITTRPKNIKPLPIKTPTLSLTPTSAGSTPALNKNQELIEATQAGTPNLITPPTPTLTVYPLASPAPAVSQTQEATPLSSAAEPTRSHIFYTSSHWKAKYYYCDTDNGWKNLSPTYLKSFSSPEELLKSYPTRILHEPCKQ